MKSALSKLKAIAQCSAFAFSLFLFAGAAHAGWVTGATELTTTGDPVTTYGIGASGTASRTSVNASSSAGATDGGNVYISGGTSINASYVVHYSWQGGGTPTSSFEITESEVASGSYDERAGGVASDYFSVSSGTHYPNTGGLSSSHSGTFDILWHDEDAQYTVYGSGSSGTLYISITCGSSYYAFHYGDSPLAQAEGRIEFSIPE